MFKMKIILNNLKKTKIRFFGKKKLILIILNIYIIFANRNRIMYNYNYMSKNPIIDSPQQLNSSIILKEKEELLKYISKSMKANIKRIETIFLDYKCNFGNQLILLNKVIFFCEILGCKRILLNKDFYWFIKNKIIYKKYGMIIEVGDEKDYKNKNIIIDRSHNFFWYFNYINPQFRSEIIKQEILSNLPKMIIDPNTLFIYIRSGDIFKGCCKNYFQPPLCFYQRILNIFKFQNITIIAEDKNNPVIDKLLVQFPNIFYKNNSLKIDISYLAYSYNLVGGFSTFVNNIIRFNDNLKLFWYYEFKKSFFFSFEFNHKNISIFKMKVSDSYYDKLKMCNTSQCETNIILNSKCVYNFIETKNQ